MEIGKDEISAWSLLWVSVI